MLFSCCTPITQLNQIKIVKDRNNIFAGKWDIIGDFPTV